MKISGIIYDLDDTLISRDEAFYSGFTKNVGISELVTLGRKNRIPVMADLGCGETLDLSSKGIYLPRSCDAD